MKKLNQFVRFLFEDFSKGKVYRVIGVRPWIDYTTKEHMGTKVDVIIAEDNTAYDIKNDEIITNQYEKLAFKIKKDVNIPMNARVIPVNPVAVVYGEYRNQLSVTADDIKVITPQKVTESLKPRL
ncbi:hypothetical protein [Mediterraneibacter glycyrrhizinilyticus]